MPIYIYYIYILNFQNFFSEQFLFPVSAMEYTGNVSNVFHIGKQETPAKISKTMDRRKENKINLNVDPGWPSHQVRLYRRFLLEAFYMTIPHHVALRLWLVSGYDAKKIAKETGMPLKTCYIYHEAYKYNFI